MQNVALKKNISCLYKTARLEIDRKDSIIKDLRERSAWMANSSQAWTNGGMLSCLVQSLLRYYEAYYTMSCPLFPHYIILMVVSIIW